MGTRANIIAKTSAGNWGRIYTHWDGYPDHHGPILLGHYQDQDKIDRLIGLGDLSILAEEIGVKHPFEGPKSWLGNDYHSVNPAYTAFKEKYGAMCLAYGRDRGEKGTKPTYDEDMLTAYARAIDCGAEFVYVWNGQYWAVGVPEDPDELILLREFMKGERKLKQTVKAFGNFVIGQRQHVAGSHTS